MSNPPPSSPFKSVACPNMISMLVTLDASHFEMSLLNNFALTNKPYMSVTPDTYHSPIGPCEPLEQSPSGDKSKHKSTALLSSSLDCVEKTAGYRVCESVLCVVCWKGGEGREDKTLDSVVKCRLAYLE